MIVNLPKIGNVEFPDNLTSEQFDNLVGRLAEKYDFKVPKPDVGLGTIAKRGFMRSLGETGIALGDTLPAMLGTAIGADKSFAERQMQEAQASREELQRKYPAQFKSYQEIGSPFEALQYGVETLGELVPTAATSIIPGVGGTVAGGRLAGQAALKAAPKVLAPAVLEAGVKKAAEAGAKKGMYGGVFMGSFAQNAPEVFEGIYQETGKFEPGVAALAGGVSAMLDSVVPANVLSQLGGYGKLKVVQELAKDSGAAPKVWKYLAKELPKAAAAEGLTESAQEAVGAMAEQVAGSTKDLLSPENMQRYKEAFVKGAVGGAGFGVPTGVSQYRTAKKDFTNTQEAEAALKAQMEAEAAAGTLSPEKEAQYTSAIEAARAERQSGLEQTFREDAERKAREVELNALAARMDELRPGSQAYADLEAEVQKAKDEIAALDAKKAEGSAFTTAKPTPGTGGMFMPGVEKAREQKKIDQEQGMRGFAFGDMGAQNAPADPITVNTLKALRISDRSQLGQTLLGTDMATPDGVRKFIQTMEDPQKVGMANINENAYQQVLDSLYADGREAEIEAARAEMKAEPVSEKAQKQQSATRQFAFGDTSAGQPDTATSGTSPSVAAQPSEGAPAAEPKAPKRTRVVSTPEDAGPSAAGEVQPAAAIEETGDETVVTSPAADTAPPVAPPTRRKKANTRASEIALAEKDEAPPTTAPAKDVMPLSQDFPVIGEKLGDAAKRRGLREQEKDARSYFGRSTVPFALRAIANDLVYQPTAYRNSKMKSFEGKGDPETFFASEAEANQFKGQGGVHAKNAADWVRGNLSPESVAYLDKWIAQYEKESGRSQAALEKMNKKQGAESAFKEQMEADNKADAEAKAEKKAAKKAKKAEKKATVQEAVSDAYFDEQTDTSFDDIVNMGRDRYDASPDVAALHTEAHPHALYMLERGNLIGALQALADAGSSPFARRVADTLVQYLGDVKLVYGADKAQYDPNTNTIYLPENATEYEVLHEASHAALSHVLENPSHPITKQLEKLFQEVKGSVDGAYGAKDLQEFAAEIWSNDAFRTRLKELPSGKVSVWDKILNVLRRLVGMNPKSVESAFDMADRLLNEIVSAPPDTRTGDTLYAQSLTNPTVGQKIMSGFDTIMRNEKLMDSERAVQWLSMVEKTGLNIRQAAQKFLNLSALGQVASKVLGQDAITFSDKINAMAGYYESLMERLQPLHQRLEKFAQTARYQSWSTLVHDSTIEDVNPNAPRSAYTGSPERLAAWDNLNKRYNTLTSEEKKLYNDLFKSYKVLFGELKNSIRANLLNSIPDEGRAMSAYNKIIDQITKMGIDHYAPLYRKGMYWMTYTDPASGELVSKLYESQVERAADRKKIEQAGGKDFDEFSRIDQLKAKSVPRGTVAAQIVEIMKQGGADEKAVDNFLQLIVSAMPETSLLKSFQRRKNVPGYIDDAGMAYSNVTSSMARQLSRMRYNEELQRLIEKMAETGNTLRGEDNVRAKELVAELEARRQYAMSPTIADWARYASSGAFYFNLAGNVSSAVVNLLQTPMVVLPQLGGAYGFRDAARALGAATRLYSGSGFTRKVTDINGETADAKAMLSIENLVNSGKAPQYAALVKHLKDLGFLQTSTARDALEAANRPQAGPGGVTSLAERTATYSAFLFHHAERMNREVTAIAAFDLEMARLAKKGVTGADAEAQAIEKATRMVEYAHGAGHTESGPSIGHSDIGKVLTVFKRFGFTMYNMLFDTIRRSLPIEGATGEQLEAIRAARRQLVGVYGMAGIFAGVKGMPLYWVAELAYNAFREDDEDDFDATMRKFLGDFAFKGPVNYITNLSIADRVGWTDLIYREAKGDKADASALSQITESILGAPYSIINGFFRGKELIADGHFERGVEAMLPIALRNVLKGARYATEGANTLRGDPVMGDVGGYNAAMQVLGFAPADLLRQYELNAYGKGIEKAVTDKQDKLLKQYYIATREGDLDRADEVKEKLYQLGDKHPDLKINEETFSKSVKARDKISDEMYHGVSFNKKLRAEIERSISEFD